MNEYFHDYKERWVAALRSGDYLQGQCRLRYADEYCCFGVLCDVAGVEWRVKPDASWVAIYEGDVGEGYLPTALAAELELPQARESVLVHMNDSGCSFDQIADYIEERL